MEQLKRIGIGMAIALGLSLLANLSDVLADIIGNPFVLTIAVGLIDFLKKVLTDQQGKFLGAI